MSVNRYPDGKAEYIIRYKVTAEGKPAYHIDGDPVTNDSTDVIYLLRHMRTWTNKLPAPRHKDVRDACVLAKENEMPYRLKLSFGKWVVLPMPLQRAGAEDRATV